MAFARIAFVLAVIALSLAAFTQDTASPDYSIFGRSATFSLVTNINNKSNDVINQNNDYILATDGSMMVALVSNNAFGTKNNTAYNGLSYLLELRQPLDASAFVTFTRGNENDMKRKINSLKVFGIVDTRFGTYNVMAPDAIPLVLRLEYQNIDIIGRALIGPGAREIVVENIGRNANNVTRVLITVIR